jgi:hypothetical protein
MSDRALTSEEATRALFDFLRSGELSANIAGFGHVNRAQAQQQLCELIPAEIQVRGICARKIRGVVSAPHAGFDHWSEHYCNRLAPYLQLGWVVALNYRDEDRFKIPVSIGRHVHVNRPTESAGRGQPEQRTARAEEIFAFYAQAVRSAAGGGEAPLDLLIEIHSHQRSAILEIATVGVSAEFAQTIMAAYGRLTQGHAFPELRIEPLHALRLSAEAAKTIGILRAENVHCGLHIEIPRGLRETAPARARGVKLLSDFLLTVREIVERDAC